MEGRPALPEMTSHVYWVEKEQFLLEEDTYGEWVLFAVEHGEFVYRIGGQEGKASGGDLVLCPPGTAFGRKALTPVTFHFISFTLPADSGTGMTGDFPAGRIPLSRHGRAADNCAGLRRYAQDRSEFSRVIRTHLLRDLWLMILEESVIPKKRKSAADASDPVLFRIRRYIEEHACQPLRMKEVAQVFHLTPVQLTRRFREAFGVNPIRYVTELRLKRACELLTSTNETIDAVAAACGYDNGFYLSRIFKKTLGMPPSEYRLKYRV